MGNKQQNDNVSKNPVGRPRTHFMPEPVPDTLENVARILMTTKPKRYDEWEYLKKARGSGKDKNQG